MAGDPNLVLLEVARLAGCPPPPANRISGPKRKREGNLSDCYDSFVHLHNEEKLLVEDKFKIKP